MARRRGSRFALEAFFLLAVALALAFAEVGAPAVAGLMLAGWAIVSAFEWAAWLEEPHYAAGRPPRYYLPRLDLPPAQPLEPVASSYPEGRRDEAPTWIASAALRAELLGDWPLAATTPEPDEDVAVALGSAHAVPEPVDPWLVAELPLAPIEQDEAEIAPAAVAEAMPELAAPPAGRGVARYRIDPLAEPTRRRFRRAGDDQPLTVEVPARPAGVRVLPGQSA